MVRVDENKQQIFELLKPLEEFLELKIGHETHGFQGCMTGFLFNQLAPLKTDQWPQEMLKPCGGPKELLRNLMTREAASVSNVTGIHGTLPTVNWLPVKSRQ